MCDNTSFPEQALALPELYEDVLYPNGADRDHLSPEPSVAVDTHSSVAIFRPHDRPRERFELSASNHGHIGENWLVLPPLNGEPDADCAQHDRDHPEGDNHTTKKRFPRQSESARAEPDPKSEQSDGYFRSWVPEDIAHPAMVRLLSGSAPEP